MPCPHNQISIVQRSNRQSAVAAAAYQSGEKLFCEYDQQVKHYPEKRGIVHEKDGLPFEKVVRNIIRAKFLRPGIRAYRTENIYAPFAGPGAGKEDVIEKHKEEKRSRRQG